MLITRNEILKSQVELYMEMRYNYISDNDEFADYAILEGLTTEINSTTIDEEGITRDVDYDFTESEVELMWYHVQSKYSKEWQQKLRLISRNNRNDVPYKNGMMSINSNVDFAKLYKQISTEYVEYREATEQELLKLRQNNKRIFEILQELENLKKEK